MVCNNNSFILLYYKYVLNISKMIINKKNYQGILCDAWVLCPHSFTHLRKVETKICLADMLTPPFFLSQSVKVLHGVFSFKHVFSVRRNKISVKCTAGMCCLYSRYTQTLHTHSRVTHFRSEEEKRCKLIEWNKTWIIF